MKNTKFNREMFPVLMRLQDAEEGYQASLDDMLALWHEPAVSQRPVLAHRIRFLQQRLGQVKTIRAQLCVLMPILIAMGAVVSMLLSICLGVIWAALGGLGRSPSTEVQFAARFVQALLTVTYFWQVIPWIRHEVIERQLTYLVIQDAMEPLLRPPSGTG